MSNLLTKLNLIFESIREYPDTKRQLEEAQAELREAEKLTDKIIEAISGTST